MLEQVLNKIIEFGFIPSIKEYDTYYDITFKSFGFDYFIDSYKTIIREMCGSDLMEFYYGSNTQHIYIRKNIIKDRLFKINKIKERMFEIGEKVVCVNNGKLRDGNTYKPETLTLKLYKIYTVKNNDGGNSDVLLEEVNVYYDWRRFIPLTEYRKMQIKKLKNNINERR